MDSIQAINHATKKTGANVGATTGASDPAATSANAFSALLQAMGTRFSASFGDLNSLASKFVVNDDAAKLARAEEPADAPARAKDTDKKTEEKPKAAKSKKNDDADDKSAAASDDADAADTADTADQSQAADAAAAAQAADTADQSQAADAAAAAQAAAAAIDTTPVEQVAAQTAEVAVDPTAQVLTNTTVAAKAATETAPTEAVVDAPKVAEVAQTVQKAVATNAAVETATEEVTEAPVVNQDAADKTNTRATERHQARSAAAQEQSKALASTLASDDKIQVQVKVAGPQVAAKALAEPSSYNIYTGYTAGNAESTANGQAGQADATNALVTKTSAEQVTAPVLPSLNVAPPQAQPSQQGTSSATSTRADAVPAVAATSQSTSGGQTNAGADFASFSNSNTNAPNATTSTQSAASTAQERPTVTSQDVIDQIKVNITRASKAGLDRVTIQLKPLELGRIDVKLEMSEDHKVRVTVMADNAETLALLKSDSHSLERALNDAGLRTDANNLHFSLREDSGSRTNDGQNGQNAAQGSSQNDDGDVAEDDYYAPTFDYAEAARQRGGIDTFA